MFMPVVATREWGNGCRRDPFTFGGLTTGVPYEIDKHFSRATSYF
jgi:hypothetical protein